MIIQINMRIGIVSVLIKDLEFCLIKDLRECFNKGLDGS